MGSLQIAYPEIGGSGEQQLLGIKKYLFQLTEQLNLADWSANAVFTEAAQAVDAASGSAASANETAGKLAEYSSLRSLIIKTADYAIENSESINLRLQSSLKAISDFGEITENLQNDILIASNGISQLFGYTAGINNASGEWSVDSKQYIKTGLLYYNGGVPVYGVGVGIIDTTLVNNDEVIDLAKNKLATFTADEIAFWQQGIKVAYITAGAINFPAANITGGSINIGDGNFSVTSGGVLTAKGADISGTITATAGTIGGCSIINGKLQVSSAEIGTISADKISGGTLNFNDIYVSGSLSASRISGGELNCSTLTISGFSVTAGMIANNLITNSMIKSLSSQRVTSGRFTQITNMYIGTEGDTNATFNADRYRSKGGSAIIETGGGGIAFGGGFASNGIGIYSAYFYSSKGIDMGTAGYRWGTVYCTKVDQSSDRKLKKDITSLSVSDCASLVRGLRPVSYKWKSGEDTATHYGFIAQEVEEALSTAGISGTGIVSKTHLDTAHTEFFTKYGLAYNEFIPVITKFIQQLDARITVLEQN